MVLIILLEMNNINLRKLSHLLATGFGSGLLKPAPGTWGSLVGLLIAIFLWEMTACRSLFIFLSLFSFLGGIYLCGKTGEDIGVHDDGRIVWDEMVAIWLIFAFLPEYSMFSYLLTFVCFRVFDIVKPYPIRYIDQHFEGGVGVMFDDILAALYALFSLYLIYWII